DGGLWRFSDEGATELVSIGFALRDVSVAHDGHHAFAVGDGGTALVSHDSGASFAAVDLGVEEDILAASIAHDGVALSATTAKGRIVIVDEFGIHVHQPSGIEAPLWDVHQVSALE